MIEIYDFKAENEKDEVIKSRRPEVLPGRMKRTVDVARSDESIRRIVSFVLSSVFWIFMIVYLSGYTKLLKKAYSYGFEHLVKSKEFWMFVRDFVLGLCGYALISFALNMLFFNR